MLLSIVTLALAAVHIDGSRLQDGSACYTLYDTRTVPATPLGLTWQSIHRATLNGRPVFNVLVHQSVGKFDMLDRYLLDAGDLQPITFSNERNGKRHATLRYERGRVRGSRGKPDGTLEKIDVALPGPTWDGSLYGVLFTALPLANGGSYRVPTYRYDKGLGELNVTVMGQTQAGAETAVQVDANTSEPRRTTYLIARDAPRELGYSSGTISQQLGGDCSALQEQKFAVSD